MSNHGHAKLTDGVRQLNTAGNIDGNDLYAPGIDPVLVRHQIGMVFQRLNPFPTMSIRDNVLAVVKLDNRRLPANDADTFTEGMPASRTTNGLSPAIAGIGIATGQEVPV